MRSVPRYSHRRPRLPPSGPRSPSCCRNPLATLDDANAMAEKLFPRVQRVLRELGVTCRYGFDPTDRALLGDTAPFLDHALIVYIDDRLAGAAAEAGIVFTLSSADRGDL